MPIMVLQYTGGCLASTSSKTIRGEGGKQPPFLCFSNIVKTLLVHVVTVMWDRRTCVRAHRRDTCELHESRREQAITLHLKLLCNC